MSALGRAAAHNGTKTGIPGHVRMWKDLHAVLLGIFFCAVIALPLSPALAEEAKVKMSAEIVTPTELFVKVSFTGYSAPFAKAILFDTANNRIYIQQEVGPEGRFSLEFVLDRRTDQEVNFALFSSYKGLESARLPFTFSPSTYAIDSTQKLVLPPLLDLSSDSVKAAEEVRILGYGCPSCNLTVNVVDKAGAEQIYSSITDINGFAQVVLTSGLTAGDYSITGTLTKDGVISAVSDALLLKVAKGTLSGSYGYLPGAIVIDGIGEFLTSPLGLGILALITLSAFSLILQSWIQIIELFQKLHLRSWFLPFIFARKKKKKVDEPAPAAVVPTVPASAVKPTSDRMFIDDDGPQNLNLPPGDYHIIWQSGGSPPQVDMLNFKAPAAPVAEQVKADSPAEPPIVQPSMATESMLQPSPLGPIQPALKENLHTKKQKGSSPAQGVVTQEMKDAMITELEESMPRVIQHNSFKVKHLNPLYWLWKTKK